VRLDLILRPQYIAPPAAGPFFGYPARLFHPRTIEPAWRLTFEMRVGRKRAVRIPLARATTDAT